MSTTSTSDMVASIKAIQFSGNHVQWPKEKSKFLAQCGDSGTDEILDGTYEPYALPPNFHELDAVQQHQERKLVRDDAKKLRALQKKAWNMLHQAAFLHFTSIINDNEHKDLDEKAFDAWAAIVIKMEGGDQESRRALHFKRFAQLRMKETPGNNPALDFDEFVSALQVATRDAAAAHVNIDPAQVFDQLQSGIPKRYRQFQIQAVIAGHNTFNTFRVAIRNALDADYLLRNGTAAEQADDHTRNEKSSVQALTTVLQGAEHKSAEEVKALVMQHLRDNPNKRTTTDETTKASKKARSNTPN